MDKNMPVSTILRLPLADEFIELSMVDHEEALDVGPFHFPPGVPIPLSGSEGHLAAMNWFYVPLPGRGLESHDSDEDESDFVGIELLRAFIDNHFTAGAPDYYRLVDHVARCILLIALLMRDHEHYQQLVSVFERVEHASAMYDNLVRLGGENASEGINMIEAGDVEDGFTHLLIAAVLTHGAYLLSPTTPGVHYNLGLILFELAHRLTMPDENDDRRWKTELGKESAHWLRLALEDGDVRKTTPARFILGADYELIGEPRKAKQEYEKFLESPAVERLTGVVEEVKRRLGGMPE